MQEFFPYNNPDILGHQEQEQEFLNAYYSNKMHSSRIIHGVEGIGKATFAYRIAKFLISNAEVDGLGFLEDKKTLSIPENSSVFKLVASSSCPDLLLVSREFDQKSKKFKKEIVVSDVRKINEFMHKTSSNGNYRVVIVDEADKMNRNAQNAILKILEEPPAKTVIILVANNIGAFLPTIKSRCRTLKLNSLNNDDLKQLIYKYCSSLSSEDVEKVALLSEGSIGKAIKIYNQNGLKVYEDLMCLLSKNMTSKEVHKICDYYGMSKNDDDYNLMINMLKDFLNKKIISLAKQQDMDNVFGIEKELLANLTVNSLISKKAKVEELISDTEKSNLDRNKILLYIFNSIF
ncbi:MAG: DNA polymerase III subunit delta' [Alphaproteobacteria bacterium]|jgi:DNA polymerase-3 subunit delta'|nr:DNA polymerase III subunit delta' [Alphaproteobacteria bacterium]